MKVTFKVCFAVCGYDLSCGGRERERGQNRCSPSLSTVIVLFGAPQKTCFFLIDAWLIFASLSFYFSFPPNFLGPEATKVHPRGRAYRPGALPLTFQASAFPATQALSPRFPNKPALALPVLHNAHARLDLCRKTENI